MNIFRLLEQGNIEIVARHLAAHPEDIYSRGDGDETPLHWVAHCGKSEAASLLLTYGADVHSRNAWGQTPLYDAVEFGPKFAQLFLDAGADVNARDNAGRTPLHSVARFHETAPVQFLLDSGADIYARDQRGRTALHEAASAGCAQIAELLIEQGADVNCLDGKGFTPLHCVLDNNIWQHELYYYLETIEVLVRSGADLTAPTDDGRTVFDLARAQPGYLSQILERLALQ